jgi:hypothetical protein
MLISAFVRIEYLATSPSYPGEMVRNQMARIPEALFEFVGGGEPSGHA